MHPKPQFPIQPLATDICSVQSLLNFVQQRCRARTLTADDVVAFAKESEDLLRCGFWIPRRFLVGSLSMLTVPHLSKVYNQGHQSGRATSLMLERFREGWRVLHVDRTVCPREAGPRPRGLRITLSPAAQLYLRKSIPTCEPPSKTPPPASLQSALWLGSLEMLSKAVC